MLVSDLDTPAVICDLDLLERNLAAMARRCRELDIPFRAHTKSHKIPEIAHKQIASGANGIACQKLGDAEVMVAAGLRDILIPYNIVGPIKTERLTRLVRRAQMTVALDSEDTARGISDQARADGVNVRVIVELDTGGKRCGVQSPAAARDLARQIVKLPGLDFQGVMTYPSRHQACHASAEGRLEASAALRDRVRIASRRDNRLRGSHPDPLVGLAPGNQLPIGERREGDAARRIPQRAVGPRPAPAAGRTRAARPDDPLVG